MSCHKRLFILRSIKLSDTYEVNRMDLSGKYQEEKVGRL